MADEEKVGIKETQELLDVVGKLAVKIVELSGDGFQYKDAYDLAVFVLRDPGFKDLVWEAVKGVNDIPEEIKDLDVEEAGQLIAITVQGILQALKARAKAKELKKATQASKDAIEAAKLEAARIKAED
jgi:hypothetical protein